MTKTRIYLVLKFQLVCITQIFILRSDPFNDDLMPLMTPDLLKELPEEDASIEEE